MNKKKGRKSWCMKLEQKKKKENEEHKEKRKIYKRLNIKFI